MTHLDHLVYAASSLEQGIEAIYEATGMTATAGGSHPGNGTCNALLSLGSSCYLEIMAADFSVEIAGTLGEQLAGISQPGLCKWALGSNNLATLNTRLNEVGYQTLGPVDMGRTTADGRQLQWQLLFTGDLSFGNEMPFIIDWGNTIHPCEDLARGCELVQLEFSTPEPQRLLQLMEVTGLDTSDIAYAVASGKLAVEAEVRTPTGQIRLPFWQPSPV